MHAPDIRDHEMHEEYFEVAPELFERIAEIKTRGDRVIAVGTTMVRTLESLPLLWPRIREQVKCSEAAVDYWESITVS